MKKILSFIMCTVLMLSSSVGAFNVFADSQIKVTYESKELKFDLPILNKQDRTFYPFRQLIESIGGTVDWNAETNTAIAKLNGNTVEFTLGSKSYKSNGQSKEMEAAAFSEEGRTYIPIRYACEGLGLNVNWDAGAGVIAITKADTSATQPAKEQQKPDTSSPTIETEILDIVNAERAKVGASPLVLDKATSEAAQLRASEISKTSVSHIRPNGSSYQTVLEEFNIEYSEYGENCASGQTDAKSVMNAWMNSTIHKENILYPEFNRIGIGCYEDAGGKLHFVQLFLSVE